MSTTKQTEQPTDVPEQGSAAGLDNFEHELRRQATSNIRDYSQIKLLEQLVDYQDVVVEEVLLVSKMNKPSHRYALRIVELRNEEALRAIFHEIHILKKLEFHSSIMNLYSAFRHRQYVGLLHPAFACFRDKVDLMRRFKKSNGQLPIYFRDPRTSRAYSLDVAKSVGKNYLNKPGVFDRDSVVYVLREVLAALEYVNSKNWVHTQIGSSSVFIDEKCKIKLGNFLHARRIGSKRWNFTGNPGQLPPEAFHEATTAGAEGLRVKPNIDTWGVGLFVLEMITAKRMRYSREEMKQLSRHFLDSTEEPPNLVDADPSLVVNGKQVYDPDVDDFFRHCFVIDHERRKDPSRLLKHPFLARPFNREEGKVGIGIEYLEKIPWNTERSLRRDMLIVHTYYALLKEDLLTQICNAIQLIQDQKCVPFFTAENMVEEIAKGKYVAVEASLAFQMDEDQDWSRDVLDTSAASSPGAMPRPTYSKKPNLSGDPLRLKSKYPFEARDYQRCELVFFVDRSWSRDIRQLFIALQFARWFVRGLIGFPDVVRIVDEMDDILYDHMLSSEPRAWSPYKHQTRTSPPDCIAFVSGLRRSLLDPLSRDDPETHRYNNIFVEVALKIDQIKRKKDKFDRLQAGDPVAYPKELGPLYASATFYELNIRRVQLLEAVLLGEKRIKEWEFDSEQRFTDAEESKIQLTTLLQARRQNPNAKVDSEIDWETSNQARKAKIWGDYTRDFMFRFAKYAVPYKLNHPTAQLLYGPPPSSASTVSIEQLSNLENPLLPPGVTKMELDLTRTRSKQEEDVVDAYKQHDDVDERQKEVAQLLEQADPKFREGFIRLLERVVAGVKAQDKHKAGPSSGALEQSPAPPREEENTEGLTRLPRHNR